MNLFQYRCEHTLYIAIADNSRNLNNELMEIRIYSINKYMEMYTLSEAKIEGNFFGLYLGVYSILNMRACYIICLSCANWDAIHASVNSSIRIPSKFVIHALVVPNLYSIKKCERRISDLHVKFDLHFQLRAYYFY